MPTRDEAEGLPLPPPPDDLAERELPIAEERLGVGPWARMHRVDRDPVYFGKTGLGRFDDPHGEYGVLYAAEDAFGAFVESFGRKPGRTLVSWEKLRVTPLSAIEPKRPLRLVDLTGAGLVGIGATAGISTDVYRKAQAWSRALYHHPSGPDGLRYRLKHDPSRVGVALFDRAANAASPATGDAESGTIRSRSVGTLVAAGQRKLLAEILREYGFGLVGGPGNP